MAVLSTLPGIEAHILINGKPVNEYESTDIQVDHSDPIVADHQAARTVVCYVESVTDQNFAIKFSVGPPVVKQGGKARMSYTKIGFHTTVDGVKAADAWCPRPWFNWNPTKNLWKQTIEGVVEGTARNAELRKFRFAKINTDDSTGGKPDQVKEIAKRMQKIGVIEIKVYSEDYGRSGGRTQASSKGFLEDEEIVPEKALKGDSKSHGTALDEAERTKRGAVYRTNKKDGENYPLVIFRFLYRSNGKALKQLHVIPRTPTPSPSPTPEPSGAEDLTAAQSQVIEDMRKTFAAENKKTKDSSAGKKKKHINIKKERAEESRRVLKRARGKKGEKIEIDLTGEDSDEDEDDD